MGLLVFRHAKPWVVVILRKIPKEASATSGLISSTPSLLANTASPFRIWTTRFLLEVPGIVPFKPCCQRTCVFRRVGPHKKYLAQHRVPKLVCVRSQMCPKVTWVNQMCQLWPRTALYNKCQDSYQSSWGTKAHKAEMMEIVISLSRLWVAKLYASPGYGLGLTCDTNTPLLSSPHFPLARMSCPWIL